MTKPMFGTGCEIYLDALVESGLLVQANSGGGKSWAIRRLLEQTYGKIQHIIVDVEDEFHTLREKYDYVVAGKNGDCPADIKSAAMLGRRLLELGVSAIVNIYDLGTQRKLFVKRFFDAIVAAPRELWHPILIVLDEAHIFAPEHGHSESALAVIDLMTLGRKRGFRGVLATQRISKLSKDAAAECNSKLIGRAALDIDMKRAGDELGFTSREDVRSLRSLSPGEFFAFGPALSVKGVEKIKVGKVKTKHLRAGERAAPPTPPRARVKKVLSQLADLPHEAEEEMKSLGDAKLKIRQLEAELKKVVVPKPLKTEIKTVEKTVIKDAQLVRIEKIIVRGEKICSTLQKFGKEAVDYEKDLATHTTELRKAIIASSSGSAKPAFAPQLKPYVRGGDAPAPKVARKQPVVTDFVMNDQTALSKGEKVVLGALIQYPDGVDDAQLGVLTAYKATSRYEFSRGLRAKGFAEMRGNWLCATDAGIAALPDVEPLPVGDALREWWLARLTGGEKKLFELHLDAYPESVSSPALEEATGYKQTSIYEFRRQLLARQLIVNERPGLTKASSTLYD
jgi:hypothetical protein